MNDLAMVGFFVVAGVLLYWRTWKYGLVSDDLPGYQRTMTYKAELEKAKKEIGFWRRIHWSFRGIYDTREAHILSVAFHILNTVLIYFAFKQPWAALLFLVNPITLMGSTWVSGRAYSMVLTFALASWIWPLTTLVWYPLAIYWNFSAILYPLIFNAKGWWLLSLLVIPGIYWRLNRWKWLFDTKVEGSKINNESNLELRTLAPRKLIVVVKSYGYYFRNAIFCYRMGLFHKFLYTFGLNAEENKKAYSFDGAFWMGILCLGVTGYGIYHGPYLVSVGLLWFLINVAMWGNVVTFHQQIAERYLYLPVVGLMLALAVLLPTYVLGLLLVYYLTRLWWFMPSLINEYWNVEYNCMESRDLYYIWLSRGVHRYAEGNFQDALSNLMKSFELRPIDFKTNINIFYIALALNRLDIAIKHLDLAEKCLIVGKEQEITAHIKKGREMVSQIEAGIKADGKAMVQFKDFQLVL